MSTDHCLLAEHGVLLWPQLLGHGLPRGGLQHVARHPGPGGSHPVWELPIVVCVKVVY